MIHFLDFSVGQGHGAVFLSLKLRFPKLSFLFIITSVIMMVNERPLFGQMGAPYYNNYTKFESRDGLPQNYISGITQDREGFMWFSTPNGLTRFDGREFRTFLVNSEAEFGLSYNNIHDINIDKYNKLWLVYFNGQVDRMDPRTFKVDQNIQPVLDPDTLNSPFSVLNDFSRDWNVDDTGNNWFYSYMGKLMVFDTSQIQLAKAYHERGKINKSIYGFTEDHDKRLWLLTMDGLEVSDGKWQSFSRIDFPSELHFDSDSSLFRGIVNMNNKRLLTAIREQLLIYDIGQEKFVSFSLPPTPKFHKRPIRCIIKDHEGRAIIEYQGLIFRIEDNNDISILWKCPDSEFLVITCMFIDSSNTLWIGTNGFGLFKINMLIPAIETSSYETNFLTDILTNQMGIPIQNIPSTWKEYRERQYWLRYYYNTEGELFISNRGGIRGNNRVVFKVKNDKIVPIPQENERSIIGLGGNNATDLWALSPEAELFHWKNINRDPEFQQLTNIVKDSIPVGAFDMEVDDEYIWISTKYNGLFQLRGNEIINRFLPIPDSSGVGKFELTDIINDPNDRNFLWIGTLGGGLIKWDKVHGNASYRYTTLDGLPNNNVNGILFSRDGKMWLTTNAGISKFDSKTVRFINYTTSEGLNENELQRFHYFILPDGRFVVGGLNGYSIFDPIQFLEDTYTPKLALANFFINNRSIEYGVDSNSVLEKPINLLQQINLNYNQNSFGIDVAALEYNEPDRNQYRYKLEGYDEVWIDNGNDNRIRYNKLPAGNYTLLMTASNTSGVWNPEVRQLIIHVNPPPWLSWWAYTIYGIILVLLIRAYRNYSIRKIRKEQEYAFNKREAIRLKEMDEIKTRFFSNITHEFRTPLTLIISPLQKYLKDSNLTLEKSSSLLQNSLRHASQLLKLVNQLLDISKLEAGQMVKNESVGDINEFVEQCVNHFLVEADEKGVLLEFHSEAEQGLYLFDQSKWEKIIFNLLANALKFTTKGSIQVSLNSNEVNNQYFDFRFKISDTGTGIPEDHLPHIFERFYQVDDSTTRIHEGTGIGLALVKELVDLMKGKIEVISEEGKGTTFIIEVQVEKLPASSEPELPLQKIETGVEETEEPAFDFDIPVLLVAEDNAELLSFISESLSAHWRVIQASTGIEAWELIEKELPEIVVSDIMMPGMTGMELCKRSKTTPLTKHINFIMLTARAAQESKVAGLEAGADDYIAKPFHPYELELRIRNLLHQQEQMRMHLIRDLFPENPDSERKHVDDSFINSLYSFLENNLDDPLLDTENMARAMSSSKSTLNRKLRALLNITPNELVKQFRLQKSIELIKSGYRMSEIAYAIGFESPSYFARCFKEQFNKTPSEFAESLS